MTEEEVANVHFLDCFEDPGESLVQQAMRQIEAHIWGKGLKVGDILPGEAALAEELGVSRTVVREAVGALAALGVIDVGNGRRPRVGRVTSRPISISLGHALHTGQITFQQIWDVRRRLEAGAAALAATNRTAEQAVQIMVLAQHMLECDPHSKEMGEYDMAFHRLIAIASGNVLVEQIATAFHPLMQAAMPLAWSTRSTTEEQRAVLDLHMAISRAIIDRDAAAAEAAMHAHFDSSIAAIIGGAALLQEREGGPELTE